jgi:uncharacterized protein YbjT (DUF2867 family)
MEPHKTFFVTGASGNQGSATARNIAQNGFKVKALIRNPASAAAEKLKHPNIEIVQGDLNDPLSYKSHLKNIDGAFALFTFIKGVKNEIWQGKSFVDSAKEMNVPFILYSSVIGADSGSGIPHWESKNEIEQYLKNSGISYTIIRPSYFYQNFLFPEVHKRILKGKLVTPVRKDKVFQLISTDDVGRIAATILVNKEKYNHRTITIAADQMDMQTVAKTFSEVLGKPVSYSQLPGLLTRIFMGGDLHTMFKYMNSNDMLFVKNMQELKTELPFLTSFKDWVASNKSRFIS